MTAAASKLYADDVSLLIVILDTNPFFYSSPTAPISFSSLLRHVIPLLNAVLLLNQSNHFLLIAAGAASCGLILDSDSSPRRSAAQVSADLIEQLQHFVAADREKAGEGTEPGRAALMSGALSIALCYIQRVFRSGALHPQPRILCLQGSPDGPEQYVAVMNAIFSAQRSMVPIDSCVVGVHHSAFLQQASYITGGVYLKPQLLEGLYQYLADVFATDLQSRSFLQLPKPAGVDFRASCFCHKKTIDMGYVCSVCLSIFCKPHKKCSTCGSNFNQVPADHNSTSDRKGKSTEA